MTTSLSRMMMIGSFCLLMLVLLAWLPFNATAQDTVKIGMVTTLSGPFEFVGRTYVAGITFAVDEQNEKGGLLGKKIEVLIDDDEFKTDVALRRVKNLILEKKINFVTGGGSGTTIALNKLVTDYKTTIQIDTTASADAITGKEFSPYSFNVCYNSYSIASALAYAMKETPYRRFFLLNMDYALGRESAKTFKEAIKVHIPNVEIVGEDYHPPATKDFSPYITKIIASKADAIYTANYGPDFLNLVKQARDLGLAKSVPFLGVHAGDPYALSRLKDEGVGIYQAATYSMNVKTPENQRIIAKYHERHKNDKDYLTWWPYSQLGITILGWKMVFAAVEKAGSLDPQKIIETFEGFKYESAVGPWTMRKCDHLLIPPYFVGVTKGGWNPYFNGSIRPEVEFPWEGPDIITVPANVAARPPTPDYNPRCP